MAGRAARSAVAGAFFGAAVAATTAWSAASQEQPPVSDDGVVVYDEAFFARYTLTNAEDLLRRIPRRAMILTVGTLATLALVLPQAAFWIIRDQLWAVYQTPTIRLGWGLWLHTIAWIGVLGEAWSRGGPSQPPSSMYRSARTTRLQPSRGRVEICCRVCVASLARVSPNHWSRDSA